MSDCLTGRRVLVTGGLGFIGSNLVLHLVKRGASVTVLDRVSGEFGGSADNLREVADRIRLVDGDVRDDAILSTVVPGNDVIFSMAAQVSHPLSMADPLHDLDVNLRSQLQLLEVCRRSSSNAIIIAASTRQVYGRTHRHPVSESHPTSPVDVNGISKLAAEHCYRLYAEVHGLRTLSFRLTNTYGPRMDLQSPGRGFINTCLSQALRNEPVTLFGSGEQIRDFTYVDDVVLAMLLGAEQTSDFGRSYNLSGTQPCSLRQFVQTLNQHLPVALQTVPFPEERLAIDVGNYWGDSSAWRERTGWTARTSLDDGLRTTVAYFRCVPDRWMRSESDSPHQSSAHVTRRAAATESSGSSLGRSEP